MENTVEIVIHSKTHGTFVALIDAADYELVSQYKWCIARCYRDKFYVCTHVNRKGTPRKRIYLHRLILGLDGPEVDHINGITTDCRRANLRYATTSQNQANRGPDIDSRYGMKGVYWHKATKKWRANIRVNRKLIFLGCFASIYDAAYAYNDAAVQYFGDFAYLNPIPEHVQAIAAD
jgi:hypothetical protein